MRMLEANHFRNYLCFISTCLNRPPDLSWLKICLSPRGHGFNPQARWCGICGGKSGTGIRLLRVLLFSLITLTPVTLNKPVMTIICWESSTYLHAGVCWHQAIVSTRPLKLIWWLTNERPTWCHLLLYFTYYVLNMFRILIYPSSGACDCVDELPHRSSCSQFVVCWSFCCGWYLVANILCSLLKLQFKTLSDLLRYN